MDNFPNNIRFKKTPMSDWEPWFYLPPSEKTLQILKKEVKMNIANMNEFGNFQVKNLCTVFYGEGVYAFQFLDEKEVYLDK
jgi:hypothetical protein